MLMVLHPSSTCSRGASPNGRSIVPASSRPRLPAKTELAATSRSRRILKSVAGCFFRLDPPLAQVSYAHRIDLETTVRISSEKRDQRKSAHGIEVLATNGFWNVERMMRSASGAFHCSDCTEISSGLGEAGFDLGDRGSILDGIEHSCYMVRTKHGLLTATTGTRFTAGLYWQTPDVNSKPCVGFLCSR
jgi:hypothetical protein